ncbi:hypothetical protein LSUE1_G007529 [Lachnellula suecica]|uniref:Uncharacterized protein n=1 Tax=Lachnellula suecica TaxID=602035 RepID=A0A8T9C3D9_9HELO|nr:hypothetical protein LSUE1_G007529 [Lachnellula suecica]
MLLFCKYLLIIAVLGAESLQAVLVSNRTIPTVDSSNITTQGWTSSPQGRGTIDIIWSCLVTIFLCSWSVLCLQIPGRKDRQFEIFWRRAWLTALCALGPEFTLQLALGQWSSARHSVREFHDANIPEWTMKHAFHADSGGYVLQTPDFKPIPIDAKQLLYLTKHEYIQLKILTEQELDDKNKVDFLLRLISVGQAVWFVTTIIARGAQGLFITGMELTTAAFILCSFATTFCWWNKGADMAVPEVLTTTTTMARILIDGGDAASAPYHRTPLDFIGREEWHWSLYWTHWINILRKMRINFAPRSLPHDRIENTVWHNILSPSQISIYLAITIPYSGVLFFAWNDFFPTTTEQLLWRMASFGPVAAIPLYFGVTAFAFSAYPAMKLYFHTWQTSRSKSQIIGSISPGSLPLNEASPVGQAQHIVKLGPVSNLERLSGKPLKDRSKLSTLIAGWRNNSVLKDASLDVPLKASIPLYGVACLYCTSRSFILLEDMLQLRSLPSSAYTTVDWGGFFPHLA